MIIYDKKIDWEILRYFAARRGLVSCQKSVISFIVDEAGIDTLYRIEIPEIKTMENLRKALDGVGYNIEQLSVRIRQSFLTRGRVSLKI